jgi:UDP-glucose 4-epimerase
MRKVIVTGGAGFIGSHLVDALVDGGMDVHVIDNYACGKHNDRINSTATYHDADVRAFDAIAPIIRGAEYVFHEAALPRVQYSIKHPQETFDVNVNGLVSVLRAAHEGGVSRLIYAASSSAYGDQQALPLSESLPPQPTSPYGLQKYIGELCCRLWSDTYGLSTVSLRYFNVYGPKFDPEGEYALVIGKFLQQKRQGLPLTITGDGTQTRDFTHVSDVVRANLSAARSEQIGRGEVINIGAGRGVSIRELTKMIGGKYIHIQPRSEPHDTLADIRKAKQLLGWTPNIKLEDGIAELKEIVGID